MLGVGAVGILVAVQPQLGAMERSSNSSYAMSWWQSLRAPAYKVRMPEKPVIPSPVLTPPPLSRELFVVHATRSTSQVANPFFKTPLEVLVIQCKSIESQFGRSCDEDKVLNLSRVNVLIMSDFLKSGISLKDVKGGTDFKADFNKVYAGLDMSNAFLMDWKMIHDFDPSKMAQQIGGFFQQDMVALLQSTLDQQKNGGKQGEGGSSGNSGPAEPKTTAVGPSTTSASGSPHLGLFWGDCIKAGDWGKLFPKAAKSSSGGVGDGGNGTDDTGTPKSAADKLQGKSFEEQCAGIDPAKQNPGGQISDWKETGGYANWENSNVGYSGADGLLITWHITELKAGEEVKYNQLIQINGDLKDVHGKTVQHYEDHIETVTTATPDPAPVYLDEHGDGGLHKVWAQKETKSTIKDDTKGASKNTATDPNDGGGTANATPSPMSDSANEKSACEKLAQSASDNCMDVGLKAAFEKPALSVGCLDKMMKGNPGPDGTVNCGPGKDGPNALDAAKIFQMTGGGYTDPNPNDTKDVQKQSDGSQDGPDGKPW